jgi:hypothetical protein
VHEGPVNGGTFLAVATKSPESAGKKEARAEWRPTPRIKMESTMSTILFVPLAVTLMGYCAYYWGMLTTVMIDDARHQRVKRHLDWTGVRRTGLSKSASWRFW